MIKYALRKKELLSAIAFTATCGACYYFRETIEHKINSIYVRAGIAGALTNTAVEILLYHIDTINMLSKVEPIKDSTVIKTGLRKKIKTGVTLTKLLARYFQGLHYVNIFYTPCFFGYYVIYYRVSERLEKSGKMSVLTANILAAAISEFIFITFFYPFELIKTRKQVATPSEANKISLLRFFSLKGNLRQSILTNLRELYVGSFQFLLTYVIYIGIEFGIYKFFMNLYHNNENKKISYHTAIICSAVISAVIGSILTNPFEVWTVIRQVKKQELTFLGLLKQPKLWWKGLLWRTSHNTAISCMLFIGLEYSFKFLGINFSS